MIIIRQLLAFILFLVWVSATIIFFGALLFLDGWTDIGSKLIDMIDSKK